MKTHFSRYGIPGPVVSDYGPQYTSHHFANLSRNWDFEHITISPGHSQSNGMVESAVKRIIKRARESKTDVYLAKYRRSAGEVPADDQPDHTNRSMTVVTPPEPVIPREHTATVSATKLTTPQRATTADRVVTRSCRALNSQARYQE